MEAICYAYTLKIFPMFHPNMNRYRTNSCWAREQHTMTRAPAVMYTCVWLVYFCYCVWHGECFISSNAYTKPHAHGFGHFPCNCKWIYDTFLRPGIALASDIFWWMNLYIHGVESKHCNVWFGSLHLMLAHKHSELLKTEQKSERKRERVRARKWRKASKRTKKKGIAPQLRFSWILTIQHWACIVDSCWCCSRSLITFD